MYNEEIHIVLINLEKILYWIGRDLMSSILKWRGYSKYLLNKLYQETIVWNEAAIIVSIEMHITQILREGYALSPAL